jgi:hypothetical protein
MFCESQIYSTSIRTFSKFLQELYNFRDVARVRILYTQAWVWVYSLPFVSTWRFVQSLAGLNIFLLISNFSVTSSFLSLRWHGPLTVHVGDMVRGCPSLYPEIKQGPCPPSLTSLSCILVLWPRGKDRWYSPGHLPRAAPSCTRRRGTTRKLHGAAGGALS